MKTIDNDNRANKSKGRPYCGAKERRWISSRQEVTKISFINFFFFIMRKKKKEKTLTLSFLD